jgi:hypothetical protein
MVFHLRGPEVTPSRGLSSQTRQKATSGLTGLRQVQTRVRRRRCRFIATAENATEFGVILENNVTISGIE